MAGPHARTDKSIEPQFRLACEECHARKIRCELSLANPNSRGSCKACMLHQRRCLFSLRNRTGRPRKQPLSPSSPPQKPSSIMQNRPTRSFPTEPSLPRQAEEMGSPLQQNTGSLLDVQAHIWTPEENDLAGRNGSAWQSFAANPHPALASSSPTPFEDLLQPGRRGWDTVSHFMIQETGTGSLSKAFSSDLTPIVDTLHIDTIISRLESPAALNDTAWEAPKGTREKRFLHVLELYSGVHNNCKSTTFDLLTEAGQFKVRSICKLFNELSQAAFALQADTLLSSSSSSLRSDISETEIIRAALMEAIQVSIGIIQYNFQLHHSLSTITTRPADGGSLQCPSEQFCPDRQPGSRNLNDGVPKTCNCLVTTDEKQLGIQLDCLELLIGLEFSLTRFRRVMSKVECLHAGQRPSSQRRSCNCWVNSVSKLEVDTARSQVSALLKQFRNLWDY